MCCFSGDVVGVADTQIFARRSTAGAQFLVYSMEYQAGQDLAMILPLPTPPSSAEDAVQFIDLSGYPNFFEDLERGFPVTKAGLGDYLSLDRQRLEVHQVGSFEASFVPQQADFARLDKRFRLPDDVWGQLPQYRDYGFAVFKLRADAHTIHPMAFEFPRRDSSVLFFPTVHIHHGAVEPKADFDHSLYCQTDDRTCKWTASSQGRDSMLAAREFVDVDKAQGIVDPDQPVRRKHIHGLQANEDTLVGDTDGGS